MTFQVTIMFGLGFLAAIFHFDRLFHYDGMIEILFMFVGSQISDFRILTSDIKVQRSEVPTEHLYFHIDIYLFVKWKHNQKAQ